MQPSISRSAHVEVSPATTARAALPVGFATALSAAADGLTDEGEEDHEGEEDDEGEEDNEGDDASS